MKPEKIREVVEEVLDYRAIQQMPVTVSTLAIDFKNRTVKFRGRTIEANADVIAFPVISSDRIIIGPGDDVV